ASATAASECGPVRAKKRGSPVTGAHSMRQGCFFWLGAAFSALAGGGGGGGGAATVGAAAAGPAVVAEDVAGGLGCPGVDCPWATGTAPGSFATGTPSGGTITDGSTLFSCSTTCCVMSKAG